MKQQFINVLLTAAVCSVGLFFTPCAKAQNQTVGENIALHQKVTVDPNSNYGYTKDRNPQQLTDGIYASTGAKWDAVNKTSSLWVQQGTLGWQNAKPVVITIDLGSIQPISGVAYSTAAGRTDTTWPTTIYIATSDDNKTWHYAGDLVALSRKNGTPPAEGYADFRYVTHDLHTKGRYVSFGVLDMPYTFVDEIEVYRGADALLNQPAGNEIPEMKDFVAHQQITAAVQNRLNADIASIRALLKSAPVSSQRKSAFAARLDKDAEATAALPLQPAVLHTTLPLNDIHRDILAVHGQALAAQGFKPLTVWKEQRYAWLPFINRPNAEHAASLDFSMLKNQIRSDSVLLTNAGVKPMTVRLQLRHLPPGVKSSWLKLDSAIWTDTQQGIPVQDALMPLNRQKGEYSLQIPAGVTGKLWVTLDSSKVPPGKHQSVLLARSGAQQISIPLNVDISKIAMGTPRLSLFVWDYTNGKGMYGITVDNRQAAIRIMRSHFVDSPWAVYTLPSPKAGDFDDNNHLTSQLDFSNLDQWVAMWPGARRYFVFYDVAEANAFAGATMGTPEFDARVGSWIKAIAAHWKELGLKLSQLTISLVDETQNHHTDAHLIGWGRAIKSAAPEIQIFSDPIWVDPAQADPAAFMIPDILCPHPGWSPEFYINFTREYNKQLWLYNGNGLGRLGDPQLGYRQMAWRVFAVGGKGEGFWSFGDTSSAPTSWDEYNAVKPTYAPAFLDTNTVYDSIHWDAARDGVEDFEELSMLAAAIKKSNSAAFKSQAQKVLDGAVRAVNNDARDNPFYKWPEQTDPFVVDMQLAKVRAMLEKPGR